MNPTLYGFDAFDRSGGSGSRNSEEDWLDENTTASENQWSTAATTFYISDAPRNKQDFFEALYEKNNGWGESDRRGSIRRSHIVNDAETFASILELPDHQQKRVKNIAQNIDLSSNRFGGKPYEKILLAICSLVADDNLSDRPNPSVDDRIVLTDEFRSLMDANSLGSREHNRIRQLLREKTEYF